MFTILLAVACGRGGAPEIPDDAPGPPAEAATQASRAAPSDAADWTGAWTLRLYAGEGDGPVAMGEALRLPIVPWDGMRPATRPGEAAIVWIPVNSDIPRLRGVFARDAHRPGGAGEVVVVLSPGNAAWAARAHAELPWAGVAIVDPAISLSLWADPARAAADPRLAGLTAGVVLADHYRVRFHPAKGRFPPGLDEVLGAPDPADLAAPDPRTRGEAARSGGADALAEDPEPAVRLGVAISTTDAVVLARLATDTEPLVRARVADRCEDVAILDALARDPSSVVRVIATHRLARLGVPEAQAPLRAAAASPDAYQRWKAASGLEDAAILASLLKDPDIDVRREAARRLGAVGAPGPAVAALIGALTDDNSFVRRWAAVGLGRIGDPGAVSALRTARADPTALVAEAASTALGEPPPRRFVPPGKPGSDAELYALLESADATVRKDAAKFFAGRDDAGERLGPLARDPDSEVRKSAVEALGWSRGNAALLLPALSDPDPDVVVTALDGLRRGADGDAAAIAPLLGHADAEIRLRATEALAALGPSDALAACLLSPDERIRAAAVSVFPGRLAAEEPSALVRRAARSRRRGDALVATEPGTDADFWAIGVYAREDDLLHVRFSWNDASDRPSSYRALRPPVIRAYGHPDRG